MYSIPKGYFAEKTHQVCHYVTDMLSQYFCNDVYFMVVLQVTSATRQLLSMRMA